MDYGFNPDFYETDSDCNSLIRGQSGFSKIRSVSKRIGFEMSTSMNLRKRKEEDRHDGDGAEDDGIGSVSKNRISQSKKQKAKDAEENNSNIDESLVRKVLKHKRMDSADKYCLEKYGIICFRKNMETHSCVSSNLQNALLKTNISIAVWRSVQEFIRSIIYSDDYGTPDCAVSIFSTSKINTNNTQNQTTFKMMQRMLYQLYLREYTQHHSSAKHIPFRVHLRVPCIVAIITHYDEVFGYTKTDEDAA
ncbi:hypothetical protein BDC45DRAFT_565879 [Circinella umbellata]|nr:hypothetical protein BDC45DRAFT_565879 [Circinella umbellata]